MPAVAPLVSFRAEGLAGPAQFLPAGDRKVGPPGLVWEYYLGMAGINSRRWPGVFPGCMGVYRLAIGDCGSGIVIRLMSLPRTMYRCANASRRRFPAKQRKAKLSKVSLE